MVTKINRRWNFVPSIFRERTGFSGWVNETAHGLFRTFFPTTETHSHSKHRRMFVLVFVNFSFYNGHQNTHSTPPSPSVPLICRTKKCGWDRNHLLRNSVLFKKSLRPDDHAPGSTIRKRWGGRFFTYLLSPDDSLYTRSPSERSERHLRLGWVDIPSSPVLKCLSVYDFDRV